MTWMRNCLLLGVLVAGLVALAYEGRDGWTRSAVVFGCERYAFDVCLLEWDAAQVWSPAEACQMIEE